MPSLGGADAGGDELEVQGAATNSGSKVPVTVGVTHVLSAQESIHHRKRLDCSATCWVAPGKAVTLSQDLVVHPTYVYFSESSR
eukprot:CAMPEP_0119469994 /NCGR_PEP_ID=MMETSP1344-20130328/3083_1 /TAXON_ID=236787 /ORGANISM="Florenciella parvula, Strain CCMP2471" /LENGTH=83 /DNA_ID=CAMNT_0007502609 /DNA_START=381 /DNA_END=632 /DNA_ORIENTATION=+